VYLFRKAFIAKLRGMIMLIGYIISWCFNVILISIILAIIAEAEKVELESKPAVLALMWLGIPTFLEVVCYVLEEQSFLSLIVPWLYFLA